MNSRKTSAGPGRPSPETGDRVLLHLRQGDLLALQGEWGKAQDEYKQAVDLGGGIPALRKLSDAQMQRRDMAGAKQTIATLTQEGARGEDLLLLQTIVQLRTGEVVQARQALAAAADSPQKHYGLALLSIVENRYDDTKLELQAVQAGYEPTLRADAIAHFSQPTLPTLEAPIPQRSQET
jgi:thioredoxin-like negative regulator of GroEL